MYICDTLSQQMYVISFRGWSGEVVEGEGEVTGGANESGRRDLAEWWITVVNFETDEAARGDQAVLTGRRRCRQVK